jgi:hypothetical protein
MEENNNPIFIIENQNEQNVDQILDINSSEKNIFLSEQKKESEASLIKEKIKSFEVDQNPETKNPRGYVRILRKLFKKKDTTRKNRIQDFFKKWAQQTLKGLTIKRTIMVRISVSKDKDQKKKHKNNMTEKDEKNKNNLKTSNRPQNISNMNNIMRQKIDDNEKKPNEKKIVVNRSNDKHNINRGSYEIPKIIRSANDNKKTNLLNKYNTNNILSQRKNLNLTDISNEKQKITPRLNNYDKTKYLYPISNLNMKFTEYNNTNKINNNYYTNERNEKNKIQPIPKKKSNATPINKFDNMSIKFSSYTRKKNEKPNNGKYNSYTKNNPKINNDKSASKVFHMKYEGYHDNNNIYIPIPVKKVEINKNDKNIYSPFPVKKIEINRDDKNNNKKEKEKEFNKNNYNNAYKKEKEKPITNNYNYNRENNKIDNGLHRKNVYHLNNITKNEIKYNYRTLDAENKSRPSRNKENNSRTNSVTNSRTNRNIDNDNNNGRSSRTIDNECTMVHHKRNNNSNFSKVTIPSMKGGVTTVIQHFSGRRRQFEQYDNNTFDRKNVKNKVY